MEFCALASGSSGNCFFVKRGRTAVLIDVGISCKQILEKLSMINQTQEQIKAIFITHEHIDHILGIDVVSRKLNVPVYITKKTAGSCYISGSMDLIEPIDNDEAIKVDGLTIQAFSKSHDAIDPVSYSVETREGVLSVITDIGYACKNVNDYISCSDALILEANHDWNMLLKGPYPYYLKKRIASDFGHISNYDSAMAVLENAKSRLKCIMLSHLSKNNNTPEIASKTFELLKERKDLKPKIHLSLREKPSDYIKMK